MHTTPENQDSHAPLFHSNSRSISSLSAASFDERAPFPAACAVAVAGLPPARLAEAGAPRLAPLALRSSSGGGGSGGGGGARLRRLAFSLGALLFFRGSAVALGHSAAQLLSPVRLVGEGQSAPLPFPAHGLSPPEKWRMRPSPSPPRGAASARTGEGAPPNGSASPARRHSATQ